MKRGMVGLSLAAVVASVAFTACESTDPVRERVYISPSGERITVLEPVAERTNENPNGIFYNPLTQNWQVPPPYGPRGPNDGVD